MDKKRKMMAVIKFLKSNYYEEHKPQKDTFQLLISTVLSQRSRDESTAAASKKLFSAARTPEEMLKLPKKRLENLIKKSGMHRQKAARIRKICTILLEKYSGSVPRPTRAKGAGQLRRELMSLPGVGYKTADIVLSYGYGIPTIAVDTHVNRIPKRIGIVPKNAGFEEARKILETLTPRKDRLVVNTSLVRFGQTICRPVGPKCGICPLLKICDYGIAKIGERNESSSAPFFGRFRRISNKYHPHI